MNLRSKKQFIFSQKILIGSLVFIISITLLNIFSGPVRNFFYLSSSPIATVFMGTGESLNYFFGNILLSRKIRKKSDELERQNKEIMYEMSILKDKIKEFNDTSIAVENSEDLNFSLKLVKINGINLENDTIGINKGQEDGVLEGMPLVSKEMAVYGRVTKVFKNFSSVLLLSAKESAVDVKIQPQNIEEKTIFGVLKGKGRQSVYLDLVDAELNLNQDDLIVTSGLEGFFPPNLLVGKVMSVDKSDLKPFQTAEVEYYFEIGNSDNLFLIENYKK